jgi:primary-amine oxidase
MKAKRTVAAAMKAFAWLVVLQFVLLALNSPGIARNIAPAHPLDPLTAEELTVVRDLLRASGAFSPDTNFVWVELDEPAKAVVEGFRPGTDFPRRARLVAVDYAKMKTFEVVVDIGAKRIASIKDLGGLQPGSDGRDIAIARSVVDFDAAIKQALIRRGMKIPGKVSEAVQILYYSIGRDATFDNNRHRLMRVVFASDQGAVSTNSPFVDGVMAVIDLYSRKVIQIYDRAGVPSSQVPHDIFATKYRAILNQTDRKAAQHRPGDIRIEQNVVSWRNWRFRYGFNLREGLVLYQIAVNDGGKWRSVVYRASVSETLTSYLDPSGFWSWLEIMDEGGGGLGYDSIAVQPGREVPGAATALDVLLPDGARPSFSSTFNRRIYVYERDGGNLMYYQQGDRTAHARSTELVVGFFASLGNYDYGFNWVFKQDGSFAFEVELAGEVLTKFVEAKKCQICAAIANGTGSDGPAFESHGDDRYGTLVYPNVVALNHQHWFNLRLDFDIDGAKNAIMENNMQRVERNGPRKGPGDDPVFTETHTVFTRAVDAKRDADHEASRSWTIYNPASTNQIGRPAGYMIMPGENAMAEFPMLREKGTVGFAFHQLWVTPLRDGEIYAAGAYPDQAKNDYRDTLYYYANNDSIYDQDIVVWYSLGMIHAPRVEDYPLMSDVKLGVNFLPDGFFSRNPVLGPTPGR